MKRLSILLASLALVATACAQPPGGGAATGTATAAASPVRGGTFIFAMWQEPTTLAPHHANQTIAGLVADVAVEGLAETDPDGAYVPVLAKQIPTLQNGGVTMSTDGKKISVKWELQPGLKWSDGQPVTSQDIVFTWQTYMKDPKTVTRTGFSDIETIDTPNELTAVVNYKTVYASYQLNFPYLIPRHLLQNEPDISKTDYIRRPLGTGPFKFTEFKAGESITAERNTNYRVKDKPYLDKLIFKSVPSSQVAIAQLKAGEVHGVWSLVESEAADVEKDPNIKLVVSPSNSVERIELNLAANANPADPKVPHPFLGDVRARRALVHATPKEQINEKLLFGKAKVGQSVSPQGWAAEASIQQESYDVKKANELLDQAGWSTKGADGIRTKGGARASLVIHTTTGNQLRERVQQVIVDEWKQIGVELKIQNMPSAVLLSGSWDNDPRQRGNYDMALYTTTAAIDPHVHMNQRYHSRQIPTAQNTSGQNRVRLSDPELDKMIDEAGSTLDQAKRKDLYGKIFRKINENAPAIWLYARQGIDAHGPNVGGWKQHARDEAVWNVEDWFLRPQ